jgi:hypothetical protein
MSNKTSRRLKYFVVLVGIAVIIETLVRAGSITGSSVTPVLQSGVKARPVVTIKRLREPLPDANAILRVQFPDNDRAGKPFRLRMDNGVTLFFQDDGKRGDEEADDGMLSSPININFDDIEANRSRILGIHRALNADSTIPRFSGRVLVGETPLQVTDPDTLTIDDGTGSGEALSTALAIDPARSLLITHPSVIEDPTRTFNPCSDVGTRMGKWTFGYLMTQLANQTQTGIDPRVFTRQWLAHWEAQQTINTFGVPARAAIRDKVIIPWELSSGGIGAPLDLSEAPFRLLAIVNRIDLRGNSGYTLNNAGEARFVFGVIDRTASNSTCCVVSEMTVILEYGIDRSSCADVKSWAQQWVALSSIPMPSAQFNQALENITEQFVRAGAAPHKVNGSALNQLRTNDFLQPAPIWELREFRLTPGPEDPFVANGHLKMTTVKLTPDEQFNNTATLGNYLNANFAQVCAEQHIVPLQFGGGAFLGGNSFVPPTFWDSPAFVCPPGACNVEFKFSFNTCSGCHLGETGTAFYHIRPTPFGQPPALSPFLSGAINVTDPRCAGVVNSFDEMNRRRLILDQIANQICPKPCGTCCIEPATTIQPICEFEVLAMGASEIVFIAQDEAVLRTGPGFVH